MPLQIACGFGSPHVAQQLIDAGASLRPIRWPKIIEKPAIVEVSYVLSAFLLHLKLQQVLLRAGAELEDPGWSAAPHSLHALPPTKVVQLCPICPF